MGKKKDFGPKEPGQQYEEIKNAQRQQGHERLRNIDKSKQRDKEELKGLGEEALEQLRRRKQDQDDRLSDHEE